MSNGRIFLVGQDEAVWIPMVETPYTQEEILQRALAHYPDLLPGDQINPEDPRRWLLVKRELGVPGEANNAASIWSLDHLFLDQDGIPTFVECKRAADTRSRREVVAQMLDYAANGTAYWSLDQLRQAAAETARSQDLDLDEQIQELLDAADKDSVQVYWQQVENNLRQGRIRLIFVADTIPRELRRLIEFLNSKMADVEVLAVEVKQFLGHGQKAMVPRVIGLTEAARSGKTTAPKRRLTREQFLENCPSELADFYTFVLDEGHARGHATYWGEKGFSMRGLLPQENRLASYVYGYPPNIFQFYFSHFENSIPADKLAALRKELLAFGLFRESGKKTLTMEVVRPTEERLRQMYIYILDELERLIEESAGTEAAQTEV